MISLHRRRNKRATMEGGENEISDCPLNTTSCSGRSWLRLPLQHGSLWSSCVWLSCGVRHTTVPTAGLTEGAWRRCLSCSVSLAGPWTMFYIPWYVVVSESLALQNLLWPKPYLYLSHHRLCVINESWYLGWYFWLPHSLKAHLDIVNMLSIPRYIPVKPS